MSDPYEKVASGEPLKIMAETWNRLLENAKDNQRGRGAIGTPLGMNSLTPSMRVLVENGTGGDLDEFSVVQVSSPSVIPIPPVPASTGVSDNRFDILDRPLFEGIDVEGSECAYAILAEPIADGEIGTAVMGGTAIVTVNITNETHKYADVDIGSYNLKSTETGRAYILHKASSGTGNKLCVVHVEQIPQSGVIPASADCSIQINTCPIFKWLKNDAGVLTEYETDPGSAIRVQDGITVEYQGWCGPITAASWSSGTATVTSAGHPLTTGDIITITGVDPDGYNVSSVAVTATTTDTISFALASDPGTYLAGGVISAPSVIYCVDNPDDCCEDAALTFGCCTPYTFTAPAALHAKITNTTGDAVGIAASSPLTMPWVAGGSGSPSHTTTDINVVAPADAFGLNIYVTVGCVYDEIEESHLPTVRVFVTSGAHLTFTIPGTDWVFDEVFSPDCHVRKWECIGSNQTWAPGASEAITHVSVSYDGGLTESASFDFAIGSSP